MTRFDAAVIGAGAVGLACAERLARRGLRVVLIEREARHGLGASSRGSGVLHAGLYYPPGSLKARLCVRGKALMEELCARHQLFCRQTGKLVVACTEDELPRLRPLLETGQANGVEGLEMIDGADIASFVPGVRGVGALWCPGTKIVDAREIMRRLEDLGRDAGVSHLWKAELRRARREGGEYALECAGLSDPVHAGWVLNAAGFGADRVAAAAGLDVESLGYRQFYFKGQYFKLRRPLGIHHLVYPVPEKTGLGVHLTLRRDGSIRFGPDSAPSESLDYEADPRARAAFARAIGKYLPGIAPEELEPDGAGIRPRLSADGAMTDFVIAEESSRGLPGWVNLVGIDSPGLTASLAIAEDVEARLAALYL